MELIEGLLVVDLRDGFGDVELLMVEERVILVIMVLMRERWKKMVMLLKPEEA